MYVMMAFYYLSLFMAIIAIQFFIVYVNCYYQQHYGSPKSFGYKTEIHHPARSYVYHEQHFPKISKSYYDNDNYGPNRHGGHKYNFDDDGGFKFDHYSPPMKRQIITYHHQAPPPPPKKTEKENDSIKFSVDIPVKNMDFGKGLEKEIMSVHEGITKSDDNGMVENNYGNDNSYGGVGDEKEMKKDLSIPEISIPKFDVDGMLDKIK
ncbi:uncharacterized protein LOC124490261 [Dermatophagoides farinae]|uniref:uncharacterized protein LOC124490261 n=1 Tax=Dermatophagoides farinae TaxID=6954 RepID=UPI003F61DB84